LPGVSEECSLTHPGKKSGPLNVEISGFDSQPQEVNCHRGQPEVVRQSGMMLSRDHLLQLRDVVVAEHRADHLGPQMGHVRFLDFSIDA